jgi:hypothetical protein
MKVFCPKCHRLAAQVIDDDKGVRITQNGKVLVNFGKGSTRNSLSVMCPAKHPVKVKV